MKKEYIIKELTPTMNLLIKQNINKYQHSKAAIYFNEAALTSVGLDLRDKIANKVISGEIEKKGMFNYFKTSFKNEMMDMYHENFKTTLRGLIHKMHSENIDEENIHKSSFDLSTEEKMIQNETKLHIINYLKKFDDIRYNYSDVIYLYLSGFSNKEIAQELKIKIEKVNRTRIKAIELLKDMKDLNSIQNVFESEEDLLNDFKNNMPIFKEDPLIEQNIHKVYTRHSNDHGEIAIKLQIKIILPNNKKPIKKLYTIKKLNVSDENFSFKPLDNFIKSEKFTRKLEVIKNEILEEFQIEKTSIDKAFNE